MSESRTTAVKAALGNYLGGFYADFVPDTDAGSEWGARGLGRAVFLAPGRMVDAVDEMMSKYRRNDNNGKPGESTLLPVMFVAVSKDYTPIQGDFGRQMSEKVPFSFPDDPKGRMFYMRALQGEFRVQVVVVASESATASAIAAQLCLWLTDTSKRSFKASYSFAGMSHQWPLLVQTPDVQVVNMPQAQDNLTALAVDFVLRATIPIFYAPKAGDATDGRGMLGDANDPPGFAVVTQVVGADVSGAPTGQAITQFMVATPASRQANPNWPKG